MYSCRVWIRLPALLLCLQGPWLAAQIDTTPPVIQTRFPTPGTTVQGLNAVEVIFSEPVAGVDPADLLVNGVPATDILFGVPGQFVWEFPSPATGQVTIAFAPANGITDLADPPNPFAGGSWTYTYDPNSQPATFLITEFMADNKHTLNDEDGDQSDWIEIYNPLSAAGDLGGWFLTDDPGNLTKWRFPSRTLEAMSYLVVFASGKNRTNSTGNLHTSFQLSSGGEFLALVDPATNVVSDFSPFFPPQQADVSYGRDRANPSIVGYFTTPTPGAPNASGGSGFAPEVQFSQPAGTFLTNQPFALTLSTPVTNAVIYYAFGTNLPGSNSPTSLLYTNPIAITNTTIVRTRAFVPGLLPGPITTKNYVGLATQTNVLNFNSDLPIMILHDYGQGVLPALSSAKRFVLVQTFETPCGRSSMTNPPTLSLRGMFHTRGSSTIVPSSSKASFALEVRDEFDDDLEVPLLGLPKESDWVLYAPNNFDPPMFHNQLSHQLIRDMGQYGSHTRAFEVFLKDDSGVPGPITSADYQGIYVLEEKIKRDNNRVNIAKLEPEHIAEPQVTGGYIFSIDRTVAGEGQLSAGGAVLNWIEPSYFTMTNAVRTPQVNWIRGYLNSFNGGLLTTNYTNSATTNYYGNYIDPDQWAVFHIHEVTVFNVDALRLSGYFFKDRSKRIEYGPTWDYDRTQGSTDGRDFNPRIWRSPVSDFGTDFFNFTPWWNRLFAAPDFWQTYIDHYQDLRRPGNALSFENIVARINMFANEVREAQPRDQAKWGIGPRSGVITAGGYTYNFGTPAAYQNEVNWKYAWYSNRLDFMDTNFLPQPIFSSSGGPATNGTRITLNPGPKAGTIIVYTLDGTDPRLPGGRISPTAFTNLASVSLTITSNVDIVARSFNSTHRNLTGVNNPPISSPWSGPVEAPFYLNLPPLRITELMYHPPDTPAGSIYTADDFEYIEFTNIGGQPLNLNRFRLRGGVDFDFPNVTLGAGQSGVIVHNPAAFLLRYGAGPLILGVYTNDVLSNDSDELRLIGSLNEPILDFTYHDDWYPATDGAGFSLVIVDPTAPPDSWNLKESWRASGVLNGSPGGVDPALAIPPIVINEVSTHNNPPNYDAIELQNPTPAAVDLGGWYLTDAFGTPKKFRIPVGTMIPANGYFVFYATNQSNPALAFGRAFHLDASGDQVYLFSANPATSNLTGYAQGFDFGAAALGVTFGRYIASTGGDQFPAQATPTLGAANAGPLVGPVVISEISYHPPDVQFTYRAVDNCIDEYIELQNISGTLVPLYDPAHLTNTWGLRDAVSYTFPTGVTIPPGGTILVVPIDPANNQQASGFRTRNQVPDNVPLYGPWQGQLDNGGASVELVRPDLPNSAGNAPQILVERVKYSDDAPWPQGADGYGPTLQRIVLSAYGNDPANWTAASPTAGTLFAGGTGPSLTQQPSDANVIEGTTASFSVVATGPGPLTYQWLFNGKTLAGQTASSVNLLSARPDQAGVYACLVFNPFGTITSSNATLTIKPIAKILQGPVKVALRGSTNIVDYGTTTNNASFGVTAISAGILHYQWRKNGANIAGANQAVLTIPNVTLADDASYDVVVSDEVSTLTSNPARLSVLLTPVFLVTPVDQIIASNGTFTAGTAIRGNPPPFRYEWREVSLVRGSNITSETTNFFTSGPITNRQPTNTWRLVIFNEAASNVLASFSVIILPDADHDGIPDDWETRYGLNPNDPSDRDLDRDGDGLSNYQEWLAGTDPTDPASNLRVDIASSPGSAVITVGLPASHTFTLQYSSQPVGGPWNKLVDLFARTTNRVETIVDTSGDTNRFYRLTTPRQP